MTATPARRNDCLRQAGTSTCGHRGPPHTLYTHPILSSHHFIIPLSHSSIIPLLQSPIAPALERLQVQEAEDMFDRIDERTQISCQRLFIL